MVNLSLTPVTYVGLNSLINGEMNILCFAGYLFTSTRLTDGVAVFNQSYGELIYIDPSIERIKVPRSEEIRPGRETEFELSDTEGKNVEFSYLDDKKVVDNISFETL